MNRHSRYTAKKLSQARLRTPDGLGSLRKLLYPVLLLLFFAGQLGCGAYFNTFYNAQKYFKEAEKKRLKQQQTARRGGLNSSQRRSGRAPARARQTSIPEYKKAIEKGSKVLELYPNSRYVDDALMIIGKSLYYTNDFLKAKRKFEELLKYFPKSEYAPEARLWLAKTLIALKDYDSALGVLQDIIQENKSKRLAGEAQMLLGELYFTQKDYLSAVKEFQRAVKMSRDKREKIRALLRIGQCYIELGDYRKAAEAFKDALDRKPPLEQRYDVQIRYGQALRALGEYSQALKVFEKMTRQALTRDEMATIRLEIERTLIAMGEYEKAQIVCEDIVHDYAKSDHAAKALFELGKMYAEKLGDLARAKKQFEEAQAQFRQSTVRDSVQYWLRNLDQWDQLEFEWSVLSQAYERQNIAGDDTVGEYIVEEPENPDEAFSLNAFWAAQDSASSDSLKARAARDSTARDSTAANKEKTLASFSKQLLENEQRNTLGSLDPRRQRSNLRGRAGRNTQNLQRQKKKRQRKKVTVPKNPRQLSKKLIERANSLAELYLLQFELPDSALKIYEYLLDHFGDAPERPRWLFSMAYLKDQQGDTLAADSLYRELIADFPGTEYSNFARKRLGLSYRQKEKDPAEELFCRAEDFLFKKNQPDSALFYYRQVLEKFPKSDFAPKALYAIGWVYDWVLFDNQKAREAYEELKEKYPKSPYSKEASVKIAALEQAKKREEAAAKGAKDSTQTKAKPAPAKKNTCFGATQRLCGAIPCPPSR